MAVLKADEAVSREKAIETLKAVRAMCSTKVALTTALSYRDVGRER